MTEFFHAGRAGWTHDRARRFRPAVGQATEGAGRGDLRRGTPGWRWELARVVATLAVVGAATIVLALVDADLAPAVLAYLAVIAVASRGSDRSPRTAAVVASYLALNFWFTAPVGTFAVTRSEDFVPLLAFAVAAFRARGRRRVCSVPLSADRGRRRRRGGGILLA